MKIDSISIIGGVGKNGESEDVKQVDEIRK